MDRGTHSLTDPLAYVLVRAAICSKLEKSLKVPEWLIQSAIVLKFRDNSDDSGCVLVEK